MCPCIRVYVYACIMLRRNWLFFSNSLHRSIEYHFIFFLIIIYRISINDENNHVNGEKTEVREK